LVNIEDVGSTNGTFVDDTKLIPHVAAPLPVGVKVQIGQGTYHLEAAEPSEGVPQETADVAQTMNEEATEDAERS
jgi:pSer/pThr/pTyr-binding forkhead associated (FHA) protein